MELQISSSAAPAPDKEVLLHLQSSQDKAKETETPSTIVCDNSTSAVLSVDEPPLSTVVSVARTSDTGPILTEPSYVRPTETVRDDSRPMYGSNVQLSERQVDSLLGVVANHAAPESEWVRACHTLGENEYQPRKKAFNYALPIAGLLLVAFASAVPWYAHLHQNNPMDVLVPPPPLAATSPDLSNYLEVMKNDIKAHWSQPIASANGSPVVLVFQLNSSGAVKNLRVLSSSGLSDTDASAVEAVQEAAPFQPLPPGAGDFIEVQLALNSTHGGLAIGPPAISK